MRPQRTRPEVSQTLQLPVAVLGIWRRPSAAVTKCRVFAAEGFAELTTSTIYIFSTDYHERRQRLDGSKGRQSVTEKLAAPAESDLTPSGRRPSARSQAAARAGNDHGQG